jgi:hypothetical protein
MLDYPKHVPQVDRELTYKDRVVQILHWQIQEKPQY